MKNSFLLKTSAKNKTHFKKSYMDKIPVFKQLFFALMFCFLHLYFYAFSKCLPLVCAAKIFQSRYLEVLENDKFSKIKQVKIQVCVIENSKKKTICTGTLGVQKNKEYSPNKIPIVRASNLKDSLCI